MRASRFSVILFLLSICLIPSLVQAQDLPPGISVSCDTGGEFENGIGVTIIQMRSGFTYTATAIGIDDFDPVIAVLDEDGNGLCNDDASSAASFDIDLPTTGSVRAGNRSAQVTFDQNSSEAFADITIVVGGYNSMVGEFVLVVEGMAVTSADGLGDPFSLQLTPSMVESGVPVSVYMLGREGAVDPFMYLVDGDANPIEDSSGDIIGCDDAGNSGLCWGESFSLASSSISDGSRTVQGESIDSMLSFDLTGFELDSDPDFNFLQFIFTSYQQATTGQYVLAFHMGIGEVSGGSAGK